MYKITQNGILIKIIITILVNYDIGNVKLLVHKFRHNVPNIHGRTPCAVYMFGCLFRYILYRMYLHSN